MADVPPILMPLYQQNQTQCSGFMRALTTTFKLKLSTGNADAVIDDIKAHAARTDDKDAGGKDWVEIGAGPQVGQEAAKYAGQGYLVLALLKHDEYQDAATRTSGHIAVVLNQATGEGYPYVICGSNDNTGAGRSAGDKAVVGVGIGVWRRIDAPHVYYYRTAQPLSQLQAK